MLPRLLPVLLLAVAACAGDEPADDLAELAGNVSVSALAVEPLAAACPESRSDELCTTLRSATLATDDDAAALYQRAGQIIADRIAAEPRAQVLGDAAVRWWVRERAVALLAWNAVPDGTDAFVAAHFPAYPAGSFAIARAVSPPRLPTRSCERPTEALVIFVGVLRSTNHQEFDRQAAALESAFPCLRTARVEYDSFVPTGPNAARARALIAQIDAELGPVPLHFIGYSQGATNALRTLVDYPEIAARTRTFVSMSSAAHGSETADALLAALALADRPAPTCDDLPPFARAACHAVDSLKLHPIADFLHTGLASLGFDFGDIDGSTLGDFLRRHADGLRSLGTVETARFWRERGAQLPTSTLYLSFRSFIGDPGRNLPQSNAWSYLLLAGVDRKQAENDMQVRLVNQALGGPLAQVEVVMPAAEGNHWQWALTSNDLSEQVEPRDMADRMPHEALLLAYYQTLHEIGLVLPER